MCKCETQSGLCSDCSTTAVATEYRRLAATIAAQAENVASGNIPAGLLHGTVALLASNVERLQAWTPDDRR